MLTSLAVPYQPPRAWVETPEPTTASDGNRRLTPQALTAVTLITAAWHRHPPAPERIDDWLQQYPQVRLQEKWQQAISNAPGGQLPADEGLWLAQYRREQADLFVYAETQSASGAIGSTPEASLWQALLQMGRTRWLNLVNAEIQRGRLTKLGSDVQLSPAAAEARRSEPLRQRRSPTDRPQRSFSEALDSFGSGWQRGLPSIDREQWTDLAQKFGVHPAWPYIAKTLSNNTNPWMRQYTLEKIRKLLFASYDDNRENNPLSLALGRVGHAVGTATYRPTDSDAENIVFLIENRKIDGSFDESLVKAVRLLQPIFRSADKDTNSPKLKSVHFYDHSSSPDRSASGDLHPMDWARVPMERGRLIQFQIPQVQREALAALKKSQTLGNNPENWANKVAELHRKEGVRPTAELFDALASSEKFPSFLADVFDKAKLEFRRTQRETAASKNVIVRSIGHEHRAPTASDIYSGYALEVLNNVFQRTKPVDGFVTTPVIASMAFWLIHPDEEVRERRLLLLMLEPSITQPLIDLPNVQRQREASSTAELPKIRPALALPRGQPLETWAKVLIPPKFHPAFERAVAILKSKRALDVQTLSLLCRRPEWVEEIAAAVPRNVDPQRLASGNSGEDFVQQKSASSAFVQECTVSTRFFLGDQQRPLKPGDAKNLARLLYVSTGVITAKMSTIESTDAFIRAQSQQLQRGVAISAASEDAFTRALEKAGKYAPALVELRHRLGTRDFEGVVSQQRLAELSNIAILEASTRPAYKAPAATFYAQEALTQTLEDRHALSQQKFLSLLNEWRVATAEQQDKALFNLSCWTLNREAPAVGNLPFSADHIVQHVSEEYKASVRQAVALLQQNNRLNGKTAAVLTLLPELAAPVAAHLINGPADALSTLFEQTAQARTDTAALQRLMATLGVAENNPLYKALQQRYTQPPERAMPEEVHAILAEEARKMDKRDSNVKTLKNRLTQAFQQSGTSSLLDQQSPSGSATLRLDDGTTSERTRRLLSTAESETSRAHGQASRNPLRSGRRL